MLMFLWTFLAASMVVGAFVAWRLSKPPDMPPVPSVPDRAAETADAEYARVGRDFQRFVDEQIRYLDHQLRSLETSPILTDCGAAASVPRLFRLRRDR